ncbi:MAG TPA: arylesterase [Planctomycetes bacterium]|nr:arylesterase [Planctomycetota bacterium]
MKNILCFGDSNTWGYTPLTGERYSGDVRWTGVLQDVLGDAYRVIEEGLNGRTTLHNEEERPYRSGLDLLPVLIESHAPLDLAVIMLGTNDLKPRFQRNARGIAEDVKTLCQGATRCESFIASAGQILLVSPTHINACPDEYAPDFSGTIEASQAFSEHYQSVAEELGIHFLDAAQIVKTNTLDGVHWDADQHREFGAGIAFAVKRIFDRPA